jgi:hypothetical protein
MSTMEHDKPIANNPLGENFSGEHAAPSPNLPEQAGVIGNSTPTLSPDLVEAIYALGKARESLKASPELQSQIGISIPLQEGEEKTLQ